MGVNYSGARKKSRGRSHRSDRLSADADFGAALINEGRPHPVYRAQRRGPALHIAECEVECDAKLITAHLPVLSRLPVAPSFTLFSSHALFAFSRPAFIPFVLSRALTKYNLTTLSPAPVYYRDCQVSSLSAPSPAQIRLLPIGRSSFANVSCRFFHRTLRYTYNVSKTPIDYCFNVRECKVNIYTNHFKTDIHYRFHKRMQCNIIMLIY
jgi:hypothetical protein